MYIIKDLFGISCEFLDHEHAEPYELAWLNYVNF